VYLRLSNEDTERAARFESAVNEVFVEQGIGWKFADGVIQSRGDEQFEFVTATTLQGLDNGGFPTARSELREALADLSRRPEPDLTGAVQHAMGSAECMAREATGEQRLTLGEILSRYPDLLPRPLDEAISKIWGYASNTARHIREGDVVARDEAELVVGVAAAEVTYLARKIGAQRR
jgi:hypothetical protein